MSNLRYADDASLSPCSLCVPRACRNGQGRDADMARDIAGLRPHRRGDRGEQELLPDHRQQGCALVEGNT